MIYCPKCGTQNSDGSTKCWGCGEPIQWDQQQTMAYQNPPPNNYNTYNQNPPPNNNGMYNQSSSPQNFNGTNNFGYQRPNVPNYLVWSILATLLCCLPFGIVAIVYSSRVNEKLNQGDYQGAVSASNSAKTWCWVSFGCGLVLIILSFIGGLAGALDY